jgi:hypothetical protein
MSKLNLMELLDKIDQNDIDYFRNLSEEERKGFAPIVVQRWLSSTKDKAQLVLINDMINVLSFPLYKDPDLLFKLMVACTPKKKHYYRWLARKKQEKLSKRIDVISRYMNCSPEKAKHYATLMDTDNIVEMAEELGEQATFIKELKAEAK